jgi:hypothetical protein
MPSNGERTRTMSFHRYLSRLHHSLQGNRSARRAKKRLQPPRLTFYRPYLEHLEDRTLLDAGPALTALHNASGTVSNFASSLQSGPLNEPLPIVSGGTSTLSQILGLSTPFQTISSALNTINTDASTTNSASALQNELGPGFTVTHFDDNSDGRIAVTYSQSVTATPSLSVATNPTDFFGGSSSNNYFSKILSLNGNANGQFSPDSNFTFTFGADSNGFFVSPGTIFSSNEFKAVLQLTGNVDIGQSVFSVGVNGKGTIDLQGINLSITGSQPVSGSALQNIGQSASFSVTPGSNGTGSTASVTGDFQASVLGAKLVDWSPTISWNFGGNGALQAAQVDVGTPSFIQGGESGVENAMVKSLADSLGLSQFGVLLDPLAQMPSGFQDIINFATSLMQGNIDDPQLNPTTVLDQLVSDNNNGQNASFFTLDPQNLVDFAEGKPGATLITFATPQPVQFLNIPLNIDLPDVPIASFLGIVNLTLGGGFDLTFTGSASLGVGLDSGGLFVNTDPSVTNVTFAAQAGADIKVALDAGDIDCPGSVSVGPEFGTKAILELQPATNSKLYLSSLVSIPIDQSGSLSNANLGTWLSKNLQLEVDLTGDIKVDLQINTPVGGLIEGLPGPVSDVLKAFAGGIQEFTDFLSGAVEDACNVVNDVTSFFGVGNVLDCQTVRKVSEITFGQFLQILTPFFKALHADFVVSNAGQTGDAIWTFQLFDIPQIFKGDQITSGQGNSDTNDNTTQSDPSDFIGYQVTGSTLTITGAAGTDNIQVKDLGNGQIQLLRSGIDGNGNSRVDPARNFSGITQINATMNDSSNTNDSFIMDPSLKINTTVTGGAGNEKIVTGAGDDTINAGDGNDDLEGGNGNNHINAGNGHDTFVGGSGTDFMKGGSGGDLFQAGSGTETMTGGSGDDTFVAGSGTDIAHGGGGNDIFQGGSGNATFYGEGGSNDTDTFYGGSGSVTAYGGQGKNVYSAGSGTLTVQGGPGEDKVFWQAGDGNVTFDGGGSLSTAPDRLELTGAPGKDTFVATANGTGVSIAAPGATLTATNIQVLDLDSSPGVGNVTVHDLSGTKLAVVGVNLGKIGTPNGNLDTTTLYGPSGTTVNINEITGTAAITQPPQPGQEIQVKTVSGPVMQIQGLGPTVVVPDDEDVVNVNPGGSNTVNINTKTMHGSLTVNGGSGVNQFNVQAISGPTTINTTGGQNTMNVGSKAPGTGGVLSGIVAALTLNGSNGMDTANVDDTGDTSPQSGTLTPTTLTGMGMGLSGITYSNLAALNISLGSGGNNFAINVPSGSNLPAVTTVNGGTSNNDSLMAAYALDMNGTLLLTQFEQSTILVGRDLNGYLSDTAPGSVQLLSIGRSLTSTGQVVTGSIVTLTIGQDLAGSLLDLGDLGTATIGNDLSGSMTVDGNATTIDVGVDVSGTVDVVGSLTTLSIGGSLTNTGVVTVGQNLNTMTVGVNLAGQVTVGQALSYLTVGQDLSGSVSETGTMQQVTIGGSLTNTGIVSAVNSGNPAAGNIVVMTIGPNFLSSGHDMAGQIIVSGTLTLLRVAGGTPGTIVAGHVGQVLVYGGYGPVVLQIKEAGVQRRVEAAVPSQPYPLPAPPPAAPAANNLPGVLFQYSYEGTSLGLANPQWTARVTNNASTAPDQYDVSLVVYSDTAKFNLARLDAVGVSGIRNVAVEGDLLTSVSSAAINFLGGDTTPAGVRLPQDNLAGAAVRDNAPQGFIQTASIQAAAFGSTTDPYGNVVTGPNAKATDAEALLAPGTLIVQASDTFRVPFADALPVAFFMDTQAHNHHFDAHDVLFTDQAANDARGAVTALINVTVSLNPGGQPKASTIQTIDLRGDGGAIQTRQPIARSITCTGPLGDLILTAAGGLGANVTAPSIIGNIEVQGPIFGTIQTTGLRTDPITGLTSAIAADWGTISGGPVPSTTVVQAQGGGIEGRLISRGNFFSQIEADGGIDGIIAAQGNLGAQIGGVRYGGILSNGPIRGQVVVLCNVLGDIVAHGGLKGGRIAVAGSLLGNTVLDGGIDAASALVAGGSIGSAAAGTGLTAGNVQGILAANGDINLLGQTNTSGAAFYKADLNSTDPTSAAAVDAIFQPFDFDVTRLDLAGLGMMLQQLKSLSVSNGELVLI